MKVTAYCFLQGITFDPLPKPFAIKDGTAWIGNDWEPNTGQKKQEIRGCFLSYETKANIEDFVRLEEDPDDKEHKASFKRIAHLLDRYRGELNEVATAIEGLISVMTMMPFPAFQVEHVNVRLSPEDAEEKALIDQEEVLHTFGDVGVAYSTALKKVSGGDSILAHVSKAEERLSALSIYTLAARAEERFELEIAYANFFRIIEGYLGDGTKNIEVVLKKQSEKLIDLVSPDNEFLSKLKQILESLKLPVSAHSLADKDGIVADLTLLRHKLMHYNLTNQERHFYYNLRVDLKRIVFGLHRAALLLIRNDIEGKA